MVREPVYVIDEIGLCVASAAKAYKSPINYLFGDTIEIVTRLQEKANANAGSSASFPLIALFLDIVKRVEGDGFDGHVSLTLAICNYTTQNRTSAERLELNFKKVLYPIKGYFLDAIIKSRAFTTEFDLKYTDIDHFFWGRRNLFEGMEGANTFNDFIDAIELKNLQLTVKNKPC